MMQPIGIQADIGYSNKTAEGLMKALAFDDFLNRSGPVLRAKIGIESGLPHGHEEDHVALLAGVLLRDLQLNRLAGVLKCCEEWRHWLAHLEVDRPVLDLDHYVGLEGSIESMEVVIASAGAIRFEVVPVEMIVVHEAAVQHYSPMRLKCAGYGIGSLCGSTTILRRAHTAFRICLDDEAAEVGDFFVDLVHL